MLLLLLRELYYNTFKSVVIGISQSPIYYSLKKSMSHYWLFFFFFFFWVGYKQSCWIPDFPISFLYFDANKTTSSKAKWIIGNTLMIMIFDVDCDRHKDDVFPLIMVQKAKDKYKVTYWCLAHGRSWRKVPTSFLFPHNAIS